MPDPFPVPLGHVLRGRLEHEDGVAVLALGGEFDLAGVAPTGVLLDAIEADGPRAIIIDLGALTFLDSSGVKVLIDAHHRSLGARGFAVLAGSGQPHRTLTLLGIDRLLTVITSIEQFPRVLVADGAEAAH